MGEAQTDIANACNSPTRLIVGGVRAQVPAAIMEPQHAAGSRAPNEAAFAIAFGVCAVLSAIGPGLAWSVPTTHEVARS